MLNQLPRISVVTPSFNQGSFLESTIRSILFQDYPNLECIIMDGSSTDNSVEIIKKYEKHLAYWQSQKDGGQYQAITEGFKHATGDIYAYLNSDDVYWPWTFRTVSKLFLLFPQIQWLTSQTLMVLKADGTPAYAIPAENFSRTRFYRGQTTRQHGRYSGWIQQEATFWRRELWEKAGGQIGVGVSLAADFELWARFFQYADLVTTDIPLAGYRQHGLKKAQVSQQAYLDECGQILRRYSHITLTNPFQLALADQIYKLTGRGGRRWGSMIQWVRYNQFQKQWTFHSSYVF